MAKNRIVRSILFLFIGIIIFWFVFKDTDWSSVLNEIGKFSWTWIGLSVLLNVLSMLVRAIRWKLLFKPLEYSPRTMNLFLSFMILAFTNQIIPRGGEIARLGTINRYEGIPFAKLLGTALVERLTDLIILFLIFFGLVIWQFQLFKKILALPEIDPSNINWQKGLIITGIVLVSIFILWILFKKIGLHKKFSSKIKIIKKDIFEGFNSLSKVRNKPLFFGLSLLVYVLWLMMLYVLLFAYPPTVNLSFSAAAFTFGLSTLAFLLPIQAGIGAWHFVVIQCLLLFGIDTETGRAFSLVAHAAINLVFIPLGGISFLLLYLFNERKSLQLIPEHSGSDK